LSIAERKRKVKKVFAFCREIFYWLGFLLFLFSENKLNANDYLHIVCFLGGRKLFFDVKVYAFGRKTAGALARLEKCFCFFARGQMKEIWRFLLRFIKIYVIIEYNYFILILFRGFIIYNTL
jgi:hypothetical protein